MSKISTKLILATSIIAMSLLSGCAYKVTSYSPSAKNVITLSKSNFEKVNVGAAQNEKKPRNSIMCRAAGPIKTPTGESYESYIVNAMTSELELAELLSRQSNTQLKIRLEDINFDSMTGKWNISLLLKNGAKELIVDTSHEFETYYSADKACQSVAQAFAPAVQQAITETIKHPKFSDLMNGHSTTASMD